MKVTTKITRVIVNDQSNSRIEVKYAEDLGLVEILEINETGESKKFMEFPPQIAAAVAAAIDQTVLELKSVQTTYTRNPQPR